MSQKTTRRGRRLTTEQPQQQQQENPCRSPSVKEMSAMLEEESQFPQQPETKIESNGTEKEATENEIVTRSRSATPQIKKLDENNKSPQNGHESEKVNDEEQVKNNGEEMAQEIAIIEEVFSNGGQQVEMDPLVIDEPDPELIFEESSDLESGKGSPALVMRCKTRRSLTRNIPTPKTPKAEDTEEEQEQIDEEDEEEEEKDLNETTGENVSTKAEVGSDSTRLEYMDKNTSLESNPFIASTKNKSFGETLRHLSTRRTIRPIGDYRRPRSERNNIDSPYPTRNSVERLSVGRKRKNSTDSTDDGKRFKADSPWFFSRFSPLGSFRNPFRGDLASSTPKLTGYKDDKLLIEDELVNSKVHEVGSGEKRWCVIM